MGEVAAKWRIGGKNSVLNNKKLFCLVKIKIWGHLWVLFWVLKELHYWSLKWVWFLNLIWHRWKQKELRDLPPMVFTIGDALSFYSYAISFLLCR